MSLALLEYPQKSQNQRVEGFEVPGDEQPRLFTTDNTLVKSELDQLIQAAYRQIFNEQQMLAHHKQPVLESQLSAHQITVRDFIKGLLLSDSFRRLVYECNNNYRFVEICFQRVLGRQPYNEREKLAWSIVLATEGLRGFVDALVNSDEYLENFGDNVVPFQRRRILPQRAKGEVTFAHTARYGSDFRDKLPQPSPGRGGVGGASNLNYLRWDWQKNPPATLEKVWINLFYGGMVGIVLLFLAMLLGL